MHREKFFFSMKLHDSNPIYVETARIRQTTEINPLPVGFCRNTVQIRSSFVLMDHYPLRSHRNITLKHNRCSPRARGMIH